MTSHLFLIFLHLLGVAVWVGGMFFAHFCLRPSLAALVPEIRFPLLTAVLNRFLRWVLVAVGLVLGTGIALMLHIGFANAPRAWHWMMLSGIVMAGIFLLVFVVFHPRLQRAVAASDWSAAAAAAGHVRRWVALNLGLGVITILLSTLGGAF